MKTVTSRFKYLIKYFSQGNVKDFAKATGIPQASLQRLLHNENDALLLRRAPQVINTYPSIREEWLLMGKGDPFDKGLVVLAYARELDRNEEIIENLKNDLVEIKNENEQLYAKLAQTKAMYDKAMCDLVDAQKENILLLKKTTAKKQMPITTQEARQQAFREENLAHGTKMLQEEKAGGIVKK